MAATTGQLGLVTPTQGDLNGTWGDTVNNGITEYTNIAIAGTLTLTGDGAVTLANTTGNNLASNITSTLAGAGTVTAQFAIVRITGTTTTKVITGPSYSKTYLVDNASSFAVTFKASGQTGVSIAAGEEAIVFFNGTDYVKAASSVVSALTGTLPVANGGTGQTSYTDGQLLIGNTTGNTLTKATLTAGSNITITNGSGAITIAASSGATAATPTALGTVYGKQTASGASPYLTAYGYEAGPSSTGPNNVLIGYQAGYNQVGGEENTFVGFQAGLANVSSYYLTAVGYHALKANTTGLRNTALGYALFTNTTGGENVALGHQSMGLNLSGTDNVAVGMTTLYDNTSGGQNTAIGRDALRLSTTASQKTAVGYQAGYSGTSTNGGLTAIGYQAGYNDVNPYGAFDANTYVGYRAGYNNTTPNAQTFIGTGAGFTKSGTGGLCTLVGSNAGYYLTTGAGNTCLGYGTMNNATTISYSVAIGDRCMGTGVATGTYNVGVGHVALQDLTSGTGLVAIGMQSMNKNTTGSRNTAVGQNSLYSNLVGGDNTALGYGALQNNTSDNNTAVGYNALISNLGGYNNTAVGSTAGNLITTGAGNVFIGYLTGRVCTTGSANIHLGYNTGTSAAGVGNEIVISTNSDVGKGAQTGFIAPGFGGNYQGNNSANWSTTSDRRLKKNIVDNNTGLEKLTQIQVRNFEYRVAEEVDAELKPTDAVRKTGVQLGVIAQELHAVLPECVKTESTGVMSVNSDNLTWYMINAIKELKAELDAYKASHP